MGNSGPRSLFTFIFVAVLNFYAYSQVKVQPAAPGGKIEFNKQALKRLKKSNNKFFSQNHKEALKLAEEKGWPVRKVLKDGRILELQGVNKIGNPIYYVTYASEAATTTSTDDVWNGGELNLSLDGSDASVVNRLGLWDGGPVRVTHQELTGRVEQQDNAGTSYDDHATHVSGIMIGAGVNANAQGMAFESNLKAWDWDNDLSEMSAAAADGLLLSNHSYGLGNIGWVYNPDRTGTTKWEWWGDTDIDDFEDYRFGYYDDYAQQVDEIANNAPYYLVVVAAGNNRGYDGPALGNKYYLGSSSQTSTVERRDQDSYDLISSFGLSKNVLSIGAIYPLDNGFQNGSEVQIAEFSSWGPTDDGRIKPDVVGDGVDVLSSIATSNSAYEAYSGTSMATPNVTGSLQLLQEYFAELNQGNFLKAATLKGLVIQTADDAGNEGPDYVFGWGVLNTAKAAKVIANLGNNYLISENSISQSESDTINIIASGTEALKVTLSWDDPAATPLAVNAAVVNNRTPLLVNDLDLRIISDSSTTLPWILDPANPSLAATKGDNVVDNVEQVIIADPIPGKSYKVVVSHKGTLLNGAQSYSLIVSGIGGNLYCTSGAEQDQGANIGEVQFGSLDYLASTSCTTYSNHTDQFAEILVRQDNPIDLSVSLGSCGAANAKIVKAYIDWNADFDFQDEGEQVATSGVINGDGVFNSSIALPANLTANTFTRMRIVCVETNDENAVGPCGTFEKGETLDYSIKFVAPSYDIAPMALVTPNENTCGGTSQTITVKIKNIGTEEVADVPVGVSVVTEDNIIPTLFTGVASGALSAEEERTVALVGEIAVVPDTKYTYQIYTGLSTDQYKSNDTLEVQINTPGIVTPPAAEAYVCDSQNIRLIAHEEDGTVFWYSSADQQIPLGSGNSVVVNDLPADSTFYAALNDLEVSLGPQDKYEFDGGSYGAGFVPQPLVSTEVPLVIDSARLYIGNSGKLRFNVLTSDGNVVSTTEIEVEATKSTPEAGDSDDDLTDQGAMYALGLQIPEPGDYSIEMEYEDDATVFRSNEGVSGFPFVVPGVMTLRGSYYQGDTLTDAYYYLYDLKIKSLGCESARVAVKATQGPEIMPVITAEDSTKQCNSPVTLKASAYDDHTYQWERNGNIVATTSEPTYEASISGTYDVIISNDQCIYSPSNAISVDITNIEKPEITLEGDKLISSAADSNQWYLDASPIEDAASQEYEAKIAGYYTVKVSDNSCYVFSDSMFVYVEPPVSDGLWLYPNPVDQVLTVRFRHDPLGKQVNLQLYDVLGKEIKEIPLDFLFEDIYETVVDVTSLPSGVYVLKVSEANKNWSDRFIKE